jgi:hypothetical protein
MRRLAGVLSMVACGLELLYWHRRVFGEENDVPVVVPHGNAPMVALDPMKRHAINNCVGGWMLVREEECIRKSKAGRCRSALGRTSLRGRHSMCATEAPPSQLTVREVYRSSVSTTSAAIEVPTMSK